MSGITAHDATRRSCLFDGLVLSRALPVAVSLILLLCPPAAGDISVSLHPDTLCVGPSANFTLYLWIDEAGSGFDGYEAVVRFDPAALTFLSVQEESLIVDLCHNTWWRPEIGDSTVFFSHVAICGGDTVTGPGALSSITFEASAATQATPVTFDYIEFYRAGFPIPDSSRDAVVVISPDCPAQGSCCFADGGCLVVQANECSGLGGTFLHFLEDCSPNPCPQPAVCCIGDDCSLLLEDDCIAAGGMWADELSSCDPNPCPAMGLAEPSGRDPRVRLLVAPNPASGEVALEYRLASPGPLRIAILDASGRLVRTLLDRHAPDREGRLVWMGCNERGEPVSRGLYFARLSVAGQTLARRLVYVD
ncbi:MAG: hypothetical protein KAY32_13600 [Candidatus Eisenbacteria sp.]|nr:hypothetical protein [Candidatus Eisenbacteria bacterium]